VLARSSSCAGAGFRFIALADDNFYPVTLEDLRMASTADKVASTHSRRRAPERFELMAGARAAAAGHGVLHPDHDGSRPRIPSSSSAMRAPTSRARSSACEVGDARGLKDVYKDFNESGERSSTGCSTFREHGVHVLGSFIFGLPSDRPATFDACLSVAERPDSPSRSS
jgi:hypothetical protein